MLNVAVVGTGGQAQKDYLPFVVDSSRHKLVAVCDSNEETLNEVSRFC
ncbi:MAG: hypothetical protein LBU35_03315 [Holosporales bacterium]|nr:hypothetical protein [Holosporales bacterium]